MSVGGYTISKIEVDQILKAKLRTDFRRLPSPETAKLASLGYKAAVADIYWIEGINYFGWQLTYKYRNYQYLTNYIDLVFNLDPLFTSFYDWASTAFIYNAMPITRNSVIQSIRYANEGIKNLDKYQRYDFNTISKNAFNYALETNVRQNSLAYFEMAARIYPDKRDLLLVASSYATHANDHQKAYDLKLEYLGFMIFESYRKDQIITALGILSSAKFNTEAANFTRALRLQMEKDEEVRKLIEKRLKDNPLQQESIVAHEFLDLDRKLDNALKTNFKMNWLPPELHILMSLS